MDSSPLPTIHLLLMERKHIHAFQAASQKHSLPSNIIIHIHNSSLSDLPKTLTFDAIVSPANSFARLDGAFDDALSRAFSPHNDYHALTRVAQKKVYSEWRGFQVPGTCLLIDLTSEDGQLKSGKEVWGCRYLLHCPTMKVPQNVGWDKEVVYECIWSLLNCVENHNRRVSGTTMAMTSPSSSSMAEAEAEAATSDDRKISSFLMTPLATGCGMVSAQRWAEQTVLALKHFADALTGGPEKDGGMWRKMKWPDARGVMRETSATYGLTGDGEVEG